MGFSHRTGRVVGGRGRSWKVLGSQGEQLRAGRKEKEREKLREYRDSEWVRVSPGNVVGTTGLFRGHSRFNCWDWPESSLGC